MQRPTNATFTAFEMRPYLLSEQYAEAIFNNCLIIEHSAEVTKEFFIFKKCNVG